MSDVNAKAVAGKLNERMKNLNEIVAGHLSAKKQREAAEIAVNDSEKEEAADG